MCKDVVDLLNSEGKKVGMLTMHLYRPFSVKALPRSYPNQCEAYRGIG